MQNNKSYDEVLNEYLIMKSKFPKMTNKQIAKEMKISESKLYEVRRHYGIQGYYKKLNKIA